MSAHRRLAKEHLAFRFGLISDVQYADIEDAMNFSGTERRSYRRSLLGLRQSIESWNRLGEHDDLAEAEAAAAAAMEVAPGANAQSSSIVADSVDDESNTATARVASSKPCSASKTGGPRAFDAECDSDSSPTVADLTHAIETLSVGVNTTASPMWRSTGVEFVLQLGDLIDGQNSGTYSQGLHMKAPQTDHAMATIRREIERCRCQDWRNAMGNHELLNYSKADAMKHVLSVGSKSPHAQNVDHPSYYSFRKPVTLHVHSGIEADALGCPHDTVFQLHWRFIVLDSFDIGVIGREKTDPDYIEGVRILNANNPNNVVGTSDNWFKGLSGTDRRFVPYNGAVGAKQLEWLRGELQEAAAAGDRVIVAAHVPLHPGASDSSALLWNFPEVLAELYGELGSKCVVAVLAGHYHQGGECLDKHGVTHLTIEAPLTYGLDGEHDEGQWPFADVEVERDRLLEAGTLHIGHLHCFGNGVRKSRSIHLPPDVRQNVLHTLRSRGLQHKGLQHPLQHQTSTAGAKQQPRL